MLYPYSYATRFHSGTTVANTQLGFGFASAYSEYIHQLASRIGHQRAVIILEPDAAADAHKLASSEARDERKVMLQAAIHTLKSLPNTIVYLDGG
jgi:hypothetical protein